MKDIIDDIKRLKTEKKAVLLAHYYQIPEIQDIADFVGDSYALAKAAAETDAQMIVFAGVHFMAETAKILNPDKKVLIPDMKAGCSLADSCPADEFEKWLQQYPDHTVITYINASAKVKALSDIIVTSGNALKIINQLPADEKIVFAPDINLGNYINAVSKRQMVLWSGACHVHHQLKTEKIIELKAQYPDALLIAHPECQAPVLQLADYVGSTAALLDFVTKNKYAKYIVATESGILYQMQKVQPESEFIIVPADETCNCNDCPYMKLNTLEKIRKVLMDESNELIMSDKIMAAAAKPIYKMLEMSK